MARRLRSRLLTVGALLWRRFCRLFRDLTTERDNRTSDLSRFASVLFTVQFMWLAGHAGYRGEVFDPMSYAQAAAIMLVAIAGAARLMPPSETPRLPIDHGPDMGEASEDGQ